MPSLYRVNGFVFLSKHTKFITSYEPLSLTIISIRRLDYRTLLEAFVYYLGNQASELDLLTCLLSTAFFNLSPLNIKN